jgi:hypothetical protein
MTQREARAVHLAENRGVTGNLGDQRGFAETHLSHPLAEIVVAAQFAHATRRASGELAERKEMGAKGGHAVETWYQEGIIKKPRVKQRPEAKA